MTSTGASPPSLLRRWVYAYALSFAAWTVLAMMQGLQAYANASSDNPGVKLLPLLRLPLANYWIYALLTPPFFSFARRFQFTRDRWRGPLLWHLLGVVVFVAVHTLIRMYTYHARVVGTGQTLGPSLQTFIGMLRTTAFDRFWMYGTLLGIANAFEYNRRLHERERHEAELRVRVAQYELQVLKLQLQPHFLFNTLHAISVLMGRDVRLARQMIVRLSDLLRIALAHASSSKITLKQELEFVEAYLEIEKTRFGSRLAVDVSVEPELLDALVPNLVLQPLAENAVRHGVELQSLPGRIMIQAARAGDRLRLDVRNDGPPLAEASPGRGAGVALVNLRARLEQLYGANQRLEVKNIPGGVEALLEFPLEICDNQAVLDGSAEDEEGSSLMVGRQ